MTDLSATLRDLVIANRILAHEGVVDGYGHVSIRHPDRPDHFFLSRSRAPELVTLDDLMEFDLDCNPIDQRGRMMYAERAIHGGIYRARPEVNSVVHNHAHEVIPFTLTKVQLRPIIHVAGGIGGDIPVWDIRAKFGDTDMLVRTMAQGSDLAQCLGPRPVALMRGHGAVVTGRTVQEVVLTAVYLMVNAKLQAETMKFGEINFLTEGEIAKTAEMSFSPVSLLRIWEYWAQRCGMIEKNA
jgi:ribulose-5-phosphate 4-epimerase/fuculose-1-phosphate aldolase